MKIIIHMELYPEHEKDADDENDGGTGMNEESHEALQEALTAFGTDIEVTAV